MPIKHDNNERIYHVYPMNSYVQKKYQTWRLTNISENLPLRYPDTSCIQVQFCMHLPECPCSSQASKFWRNLRAKSHLCYGSVLPRCKNLREYRVDELIIDGKSRWPYRKQNTQLNLSIKYAVWVCRNLIGWSNGTCSWHFHWLVHC